MTSKKCREGDRKKKMNRIKNGKVKVEMTVILEPPVCFSVFIQRGSGSVFFRRFGDICHVCVQGESA